VLVSPGSIRQAAELIRAAKRAGFIHGDGGVARRLARGERGSADQPRWSTEIGPAEQAAIAREDEADPRTNEEAA
jgi:hypothetical protein